MNVKVLGSGSKGNCYFFETEKGVGLLDIGLPFNEIKKKLYTENKTFVDINICFISHSHQDHSRAINQIAKKAIQIFLSHGTKTALKLDDLWNIIEVKPFQLINHKIADLSFFPTIHDDLEPLGIVIDTKKERLVYVTDTAYVPYKFKNMTHLIIECNYCEDLLMGSDQNGTLRKRILKTHLGLKGLLTFLKRNDLSKLRHIWIAHLSDIHADEKQIMDAVRQTIGSRPKITIC